MKFTQTPLDGAFIISLDKQEDQRGFFTRVFCVQELATIEPNLNIVQVNDSLSRKKRTLRGMHYQLAPHAEIKIIRCIRGALFDVIVDMREDSPSFLKHFGRELSADNHEMMYVPEGYAHGFLTLKDDTEALYLTSAFYAPNHERGLCWNDSSIGIKWPFEPLVISAKDRTHPNFNPDYHLAKPTHP